MNLLIVDDEYYSAESVKKKVLQKGPVFDEIYCAYNMNQALEYFASHTVTIMILDVEMPGGSGLELLAHIRQQGLDTICIFLTAYAKFEYISKAMRLASIDYLVKPVGDEELLASVSKAVDQYRLQTSAKLNTQQANYWKESELYLWELFWLDLSAGAVSSRREDIVAELKRRNLNPAAADMRYLILLLQCNGIDKILAEKDLYEFLLKNIIREYFYKREEIPVTVRLDGQFYFCALPSAGRNREVLLSRCRQALVDFVPRFPNTFNFYIAAAECEITEFQSVLKELMAASQKNVSQENHVFDLAEDVQPSAGDSCISFPFKQWSDLLLQRKTEQLLAETERCLNLIQHSHSATRDTLTNFYYSFLQTLFGSMEITNASMLPQFRGRVAQFSVDQACSSVQNLRGWIASVLELYAEYIGNTANQDAAVVTVKNYIRAHLDQELTRESLASMVYLTPDYLSHLFKRETGFSLTNYIIYERIEESKRLLAGTDQNISEIATRCGFQNISYFSRQFRRFTGMTPREFRG